MGESRESTLGDWLDQIEKIECYFPEAVGSWKKQEIQEVVSRLEQHAEAQMGQYRDENALSRSSTNVSPSKRGEQYLTHGSQSTFSDSDLVAMFESLKKS